MGAITTKKSLAQLEKLSTSSFCRRRLSVVMVRLKMAETLREAVTFVEQGHVRVGPDTGAWRRAELACCAGCACCVLSGFVGPLVLVGDGDAAAAAVVAAAAAAVVGCVSCLRGIMPQPGHWGSELPVGRSTEGKGWGCRSKSGLAATLMLDKTNLRPWPACCSCGQGRLVGSGGISLASLASYRCSIERRCMTGLGVEAEARARVLSIPQ
jgi:hypothetical protein